MIDGIYAKVVTLLRNRRGDLERMAQKLVRRETLDRASIDRLLGQESGTSHTLTC